MKTSSCFKLGDYREGRMHQFSKVGSVKKVVTKRYNFRENSSDNDF